MGFAISTSQLLVLLFILLIANIFYSFVIINKPYNVLSRIFSVLIIWMFPLVGIASVFIFTKIIPATNVDFK